MSENKYELTGFQSPCSEFQEDDLSLTERFITDKAAMVLIWAGSNYPQLGVLKGDLLVIHRGKTPAPGKIVVAVVSNIFRLAVFQINNGYPWILPFNKRVGDPENAEEDFIWGVVSSIHRRR